ncbi:hypothetical protein SAMN05216188_11617 [Lentzea xinjiangensis]|uniref:DUF2690 domain-containing protein n=1 Tax=Lentzea xinjiangensis TaxID=402600 RepID=A0A1H9SC96_9PSEU|nr:hypothetical protein [Lentzea xinjiangensis]SER82195.1 hypothetical protein SAMN05216188_11617 [Lentzea xinjiangensis]
MLKTIGATVLAAAAVALTCTGTAQAETNPACPSGVTQIGATKYLKSGSATVASVKQFKGCNKNWGYIYVWDSWKAGHPNFIATVAITRGDGEIDGNSGGRGQQEVWSRGANTLQYCTMAYGTVSGGYAGFTEERC